MKEKKLDIYTLVHVMFDGDSHVTTIPVENDHQV